MANSSLNLSSLDFNTLKSNFKEYLKSQSVLKDYDFDGSNLNVLLDVMSYNSYLNSFYLNMIASEMFLDSAQKLESVVSHAKELNYVPQSKKSSVAFVNFTIECIGISGAFSIPKGTTFYGTNSNGSYSFVTSENNTYVSPNSSFTVANLAIYDGSYFTDTFIIDYNVENQTFLLSNPNIDTTSLAITVSEDNGLSNTSFTKVDTLFGLTNQSNVFFIQGSQNNQYEVQFGDALLGRKPKDKSVVYAEYRVTFGPEADGISDFSIAPDLGALNGGVAVLSDILAEPSISGGDAEDIESIRVRAPRYFATQQRAVSSDDYSSLILSNFGGEVDDIIVYGGQDLEPKQYGRVAVCIKPKGSLIAPTYLKSSITNFLKDYIALPNRVVVTDPDYFYIGVTTNVQYDDKKTIKYPTDISTLVASAIDTFSGDHLETFDADFRYSKFVAHIDNTDTSITSNDTHIKLIKRLAPALNFATSYIINFNNASEKESSYNGQAFLDQRVLSSNRFTWVSPDDGSQYPSSYLEDDGLGNIDVWGFIGAQTTVSKLKSGIGTIDYDNGYVSITNLTVSNYDNYINLQLTPKNKDIIANQSMVLIIDPSDVTISISTTLR